MFDTVHHEVIDDTQRRYPFTIENGEIVNLFPGSLDQAPAF